MKGRKSGLISASGEQSTEVPDEKGETIRDLVHFEEQLAIHRIGHKTLANDIGDGTGISDAAKMFSQWLRDRLPLSAESTTEIDEFHCGTVRRRGITEPKGTREQGRNPKRGNLLPSQDLDSLDAGEHEMGGAVGVSDTGPDQTHCGHGIDRVGRGLRISSGTSMSDAEEPIPFQDMLEERPITLFEDKQGHITEGKERGSSQHHHRRGARQGYFCGGHPNLLLSTLPQICRSLA